MKRWVAILFLLLYLGASTELHQLVRLPLLVQHYLDHKDARPGISLSEFVVLHYINTKSVDYAGDRQLPFKNKCPELSIAFALPPAACPVPRVQVFSLSRNIRFTAALFFPSSIHFSIWQPPRA